MKVFRGGGLVKIEGFAAWLQDSLEFGESSLVGQKVMRRGEGEYLVEGGIAFRNLVALACIRVVQLHIENFFPFRQRLNGKWTDVRAGHVRLGIETLVHTRSPTLPAAKLQNSPVAAQLIAILLQAIDERIRVQHLVDDVLE